MSVKKLNATTGLHWTRTQDGEHNGRPCYDYHAVFERTAGGNIRFSITWAYDGGGTFGLSVYDEARKEYLHRGFAGNIMWLRTLGNCAERAGEIMKNVRAGRADEEGWPKHRR